MSGMQLLEVYDKKNPLLPEMNFKQFQRDV
jgi:hypothetical protein